MLRNRSCPDPRAAYTPVCELGGGARARGWDAARQCRGGRGKALWKGKQEGGVDPLLSPAVSQICIVTLAPSIFIFLTCGISHVNTSRWGSMQWWTRPSSDFSWQGFRLGGTTHHEARSDGASPVRDKLALDKPADTRLKKDRQFMILSVCTLPPLINLPSNLPLRDQPFQKQAAETYAVFASTPWTWCKMQQREARESNLP
jgi:hypothetical protein